MSSWTELHFKILPGGKKKLFLSVSLSVTFFFLTKQQCIHNPYDLLQSVTVVRIQLNALKVKSALRVIVLKVC